MTTLDLQDREELIDRLEQFPLRLDEIVSAASDEDLKKAGPGGSPGPVEVLAYLRDFEELFLERLTLMLNEDSPRFTRVEDSLWPIERDYVNQDPLVMLHDFVEYRRQVVEILSSLPPADWERAGQHPVLGQLTVRSYAERVLERDREYEEQLLRVLGNRNDSQGETM
ncbi:MAG TPA: DinB family protein [Thermomicrobiales bacterium]|nr:DinB family protein [Thermomicrobiales bacterium]